MIATSVASTTALGRLSRLLMRQPVRYVTPHLHEAQSHLRAEDRSVALRVSEPAQFRGYRDLHLAPLPHVGITLGCIESASGYELSFQSGDEMVVNIPLCGRGRVSGGGRSLDMAVGQVLLVGPSLRVTKEWQGPGEVLGLRVPLHLLADLSSRTQCESLALPPYLPPITLIDHSRLHMLLGFVELLVHDGDEASCPLVNRTLAHQAERLLLSLLVEGLELAASSAPVPPAPATAKPYYVHRAENYMRTYAGANLGIVDLAEAAGVSARTLQYGFRRSHGLSPTTYLKRVRLEQARDALRRADEQQRVGDIAADAGFINASQFSRDYRAMFGESPSDTARRAEAGAVNRHIHNISPGLTGAQRQA